MGPGRLLLFNLKFRSAKNDVGMDDGTHTHVHRPKMYINVRSLDTDELKKMVTSVFPR